MSPINSPYLLLIDDDEEDLRVLATSLQILGVKTKSFDTPDKAMSYLNHISKKTELPAMIVSDYNMPGMNAQELLSLVKNNKKTEDVPVVVYSSTMPDTLRDILLRLGALDCLIKPGNLEGISAQGKQLKAMAFSVEVQINYRTHPEFSLN